MAKTATAEEPELTPLQLVEQEHSFVFGVPDDFETTNARVVATVNCVNPTCSNRGQFHQVFEDSILPLICGGCSTPLHCQHEYEDVKREAGPYKSPRLEEFQHCKLCGTDGPIKTTQLVPRSLDDLDVRVINKLIESADDPDGNVRL